MERIYEELKVLGKGLVDKIAALIHEGNVRRVVIKDDKGHTFMEIPVTIAALGTKGGSVLAVGDMPKSNKAQFTPNPPSGLDSASFTYQSMSAAMAHFQ